jgi:hypothetical protein
VNELAGVLVRMVDGAYWDGLECGDVFVSWLSGYLGVGWSAQYCDVRLVVDRMAWCLKQNTIIDSLRKR